MSRQALTVGQHDWWRSYNDPSFGPRKWELRMNPNAEGWKGNPGIVTKLDGDHIFVAGIYRDYGHDKIALGARVENHRSKVQPADAPHKGLEVRIETERQRLTAKQVAYQQHIEQQAIALEDGWTRLLAALRAPDADLRTILEPMIYPDSVRRFEQAS